VVTTYVRDTADGSSPNARCRVLSDARAGCEQKVARPTQDRWTGVLNMRGDLHVPEIALAVRNSAGVKNKGKFS